MASTASASCGEDDLTAKAVHKRYEGLVAVRSKAIRGKGAWYWSHLEPILVHNPETGLPKAVKLRCSLCDSVFSASNPSRTASEHLKRGTCPNFSGTLVKPVSSGTAVPHSRKRHSSTISQPVPLAMIESSARFDVLYPPTVTTPATTPPLVLSGGKEDLGALAMLEDSVKKLKSPKASPGPTLTRAQVESAVGLLSDWLYESCGAVSFSSVDHPKFKSFLEQVGLPAIDRRDLAGARLDSRFDEVRSESEARLRDAMFFQLAADGWGKRSRGRHILVSITLNLPNGTSLFRKAIFADPSSPSDCAEEVFREAISAAGPPQRCAGIISDRFKGKALRKLESQNHWMVNLCCQSRGFSSLIKDFGRHLPLFRSVIESCLKLLNFFNSNLQARNVFHRYQSQQVSDRPPLLRMPPAGGKTDDGGDPFWVHEMLEDVANSGTILQLVVRDDSYKLLCQDGSLAREVAEMIHDVDFSGDLEAALSLVKLVRNMVHEMEFDRPLLGQCIPLWEELRSKVKEWCAKYDVQEDPVEKVIDRRFKKNYHPAWSAAYVLDPLYLHRDAAGKYIPPFKKLTPEQDKDVDKLITRLVSREEAPIALHELMKWRSEGLDPLYAQAVQVKQRDPLTGKMKVANPQSSRLVWETCLSELRSLGKVAVRLIFLHATSCTFKWNDWSVLRWVSSHEQSRTAIDRVQKMMFISAHAKMDRRDFSSEEQKDAELFAISSGDDDVLNEVLLDSSV